MINSLCQKLDDLASKSDQQSAESSKIIETQEVHNRRLVENAHEQSELLQNLKQHTEEFKHFLDHSKVKDQLSASSSKDKPQLSRDQFKRIWIGGFCSRNRTDDALIDMLTDILETEISAPQRVSHGSFTIAVPSTNLRRILAMDEIGRAHV